MGLDMYLYARKYISKNDYSDRENIKVIPEYQAMESFAPKDLTKYSSFGGISVTYPVGYWRKANAVHGWFVNVLADGVDECQEIPIDRSYFEILKNSCEIVISSDKDDMAEVAADHGLEPTNGFFFGGSDIDEYYIQDLKDTITIIKHIFSVIPHGDHEWQFIYQASW